MRRNICARIDRILVRLVTILIAAKRKGRELCNSSGVVPGGMITNGNNELKCV